MSLTEATVKVDLSDFNADGVLAHFFIQPKQKAEAAAMRFVFRQICRDLKCQNLKPATLAHEAVKLSIEHIEFRYHLLREYGDNFLKGCKENRDALVTATIIGDLVSQANDPSSGRGNDFRPNFMNDVCIIHNEAKELYDGAREGIFRRHSMLLAHIRGFEYIYNLDEEIEEFTLDEALDDCLERIEIIKGFTQKKTDIGRHLNTFRKDTLALLENHLHPVSSIPAPASNVKETLETAEIIPVQYPLKRSDHFPPAP